MDPCTRVRQANGDNYDFPMAQFEHIAQALMTGKMFWRGLDTAQVDIVLHLPSVISVMLIDEISCAIIDEARVQELIEGD